LAPSLCPYRGYHSGQRRLFRLLQSERLRNPATGGVALGGQALARGGDVGLRAVGHIRVVFPRLEPIESRAPRRPVCRQNRRGDGRGLALPAFHALHRRLALFLNPRAGVLGLGLWRLVRARAPGKAGKSCQKQGAPSC
jgi:hypothetical protein